MGAQVLVITLVLLLTATFTTLLLFYNSRTELDQYLQRTSQLLSVSAIPAISFDDMKETEFVLSSLQTDPDIVKATISKDGLPWVEYLSQSNDKAGDIDHASNLKFLSHKLVLRDQTEVYGTLTITISMKRVYSATLTNLGAILFVSLLALGFGTLFSRYMARRFTSPIGSILKIMTKVTNTHEYNLDLPESHPKTPQEIDELYGEFREMINEVRLRDGQLLDVNKNLEAKVTERTKELVMAQQKMLEDAHKAGIADVATGVLHNIGNVLNTVSTNSSQIDYGLHKNKLVSKLANISNAFKENEDDLSAYLLENNRAQGLIEYIQHLCEAFEYENNNIKKLNDGVLQSTNLIGEIIQDQQALASKQFIRETVDLNQLLKRALEIKETYLLRCRVSVEMDSKPLPQVLSHRARVFQVFVNLISNSCQAFLETQIKRNIYIDHEVLGKNILVKFHDDGPGVPESVQKTLFEYGYTTKKTGHGFGLHSCKSYMTDLDGDLSYQNSDKLGGACFVITIPLESTEVKES